MPDQLSPEAEAEVVTEVATEAEVAAAKQQLRKLVRAARALRPADEAATATARLADHAISLCDSLAASTVACFVGVQGEPDTMPFIRAAWERGIEVLLPVCAADDTLLWVRTLGPETPFATGAFGIPEPAGEKLPAAAAAAADLLLIPACAVGRDGSRLGWGRGFYDRLLAEVASLSSSSGRPHPPVYAVVHEQEVLATVPHLPHDRPVDGVLTAAGVRRFGPRSH